MDTETQREIFARAVDALGGHRSAARALDVTEKSVLRWIKGERRLHDGVLEKMCTALIARSDHCKLLERQLHPGFASNRTPGQERPPQHSGVPRPLLERLSADLTKAATRGASPVSWLLSSSFYDRLSTEAGQSFVGWTILGLPWEVTKDENIRDKGYVLELLED